MASAFKVVLDTVKAALLAAPAVAGGRISYGRDETTPLSAASDVTITLQAQQGRQARLSGASIDWVLQLGIEVRARAAAGEDAWAAIDPIVEQVFERLGSAAWPYGVLGISDMHCRMETAEAATAVAVWQYAATVQLRTLPASLALPTP